jgi:hypothetical protein
MRTQQHKHLKTIGYLENSNQRAYNLGMQSHKEFKYFQGNCNQLGLGSKTYPKSILCQINKLSTNCPQINNLNVCLQSGLLPHGSPMDAKWINNPKPRQGNQKGDQAFGRVQ